MFDSTSARQLIIAQRSETRSEISVLVGITGIDGSGKGYIAARLASQLQECGVRVALISVDGWLNLPAQRFSAVNPARHFYENAIRFEELFAQLILPLKEQRSLRLAAELAEETADTYHPHKYAFEDVDVLLLEGIFLLKRAYRDYFDLSFWIDCTFETALERALARRQEHLGRDETIRAYETIYFPAQRIHLAQDAPREFATAVLNNDPRIADCGKPS